MTSHHPCFLRGYSGAVSAGWILLVVVRPMAVSPMIVRLLVVRTMWHLSLPAAFELWLSASWPSWQQPLQLHEPPLPSIALRQLLRYLHVHPANAYGGHANRAVSLANMLPLLWWSQHGLTNPVAKAVVPCMSSDLSNSISCKHASICFGGASMV